MKTGKGDVVKKTHTKQMSTFTSSIKICTLRKVQM